MGNTNDVVGLLKDLQQSLSSNRKDNTIVSRLSQSRSKTWLLDDSLSQLSNNTAPELIMNKMKSPEIVKWISKRDDLLRKWYLNGMIDTTKR